jgi:hypothetical protein
MAESNISAIFHLTNEIHGAYFSLYSIPAADYRIGGEWPILLSKSMCCSDTSSDQARPEISPIF